MLEKFLISGNSIDLTKYKLGKIRQPRIIDFCNDEYDITNFIEPFFLEQIIIAKTPILKDKSLTLLLELDKKSESSDVKLTTRLFQALELIYVIDYKNIKCVTNEEGYHLIIKYDENEKSVIIDDSNFDILCQVIIYMTKTIIPKEEKKEIKGNPETIKKFEERRKNYAKKHNKEESEFTIYDMVNEIIHLQNNIDYNNVLNWTIWQVRNTYEVISRKDVADSIINSGSVNFDMEKVKIPDWKNGLKIKKLDLDKK